MPNLPHGYKPHSGLSNFRSATPVRVWYRCGQPSVQVIPANKWRAKHGAPFPANYEYDIVGARVEAE